jgi:hypothetical protein
MTPGSGSRWYDPVLHPCCVSQVSQGLGCEKGPRAFCVFTGWLTTGPVCKKMIYISYLPHCCDKILDRNNLREEGFVLTDSF